LLFALSSFKTITHSHHPQPPPSFTQPSFNSEYRSRWSYPNNHALSIHVGYVSQVIAILAVSCATPKCRFLLQSARPHSITVEYLFADADVGSDGRSDRHLRAADAGSADAAMMIAFGVAATGIFGGGGKRLGGGILPSILICLPHATRPSSPSLQK
jgi:hypothetical protein